MRLFLAIGAAQGQSADRALRGGGAARHPAPLRALQSHCGSQAVQDSGAVAVDDFLDCFKALHGTLDFNIPGNALAAHYECWCGSGLTDHLTSLGCCDPGDHFHDTCAFYDCNVDCRRPAAADCTQRCPSQCVELWSETGACEGCLGCLDDHWYCLVLHNRELAARGRLDDAESGCPALTREEIWAHISFRINDCAGTYSHHTWWHREAAYAQCICELDVAGYITDMGCCESEEFAQLCEEACPDCNALPPSCNHCEELCETSPTGPASALCEDQCLGTRAPCREAAACGATRTPAVDYTCPGDAPPGVDGCCGAANYRGCPPHCAEAGLAQVTSSGVLQCFCDECLSQKPADPPVEDPGRFVRRRTPRPTPPPTPRPTPSLPGRPTPGPTPSSDAEGTLDTASTTYAPTTTFGPTTTSGPTSSWAWTTSQTTTTVAELGGSKYGPTAREVDQYWKAVEKRLDAEVDGILKQIATDEGLKTPTKEMIMLASFYKKERIVILRRGGDATYLKHVFLTEVRLAAKRGKKAEVDRNAHVVDEEVIIVERRSMKDMLWAAAWYIFLSLVLFGCCRAWVSTKFPIYPEPQTRIQAWADEFGPTRTSKYKRNTAYDPYAEGGSAGMARAPKEKKKRRTKRQVLSSSGKKLSFKPRPAGIGISVDSSDSDSGEYLRPEDDARFGGSGLSQGSGTYHSGDYSQWSGPSNRFRGANLPTEPPDESTPFARRMSGQSSTSPSPKTSKSVPPSPSRQPPKEGGPSPSRRPSKDAADRRGASAPPQRGPAREAAGPPQPPRRQEEEEAHEPPLRSGTGKKAAPDAWFSSFFHRGTAAGAEEGQPPGPAAGSGARGGGGAPRPEEREPRPQAQQPDPQRLKKVAQASRGPASDRADRAVAEVAAELANAKEKLSLDERQKLFKRLLIKWHPDKNPDDQDVATRVFQELQEKKDWLLS